jgi:tetratricopeptide (TPR) repeat protein
MVYGRLLGQNLSVSGKVFEIDRPVNLIGRGKDCTVVILDPSVSRMHTKISVDEDGRLRVEDLRSSNGTFLNDQRIESAYLKHGDRLRVGNVEFAVELSEHARASLDADIVKADGGRGLGVWIVLVALVLGALGAASYYLFLKPDPMAPGWFAAFDGDDGLAARVGKLAVSTREAFVDDKLAAAAKMLKDKDFDGALAAYNNLNAVVPENEDVAAGIKKVGLELKAKKDFEDSAEDQKKEDYAKAIAKLKGIPQDSAFYARAQQELKNLAEVKEEIKRVGGGYCKRGDKIECIRFLEQAQAIDPEDKALADEIAKLKGGQ